MSKFIGYGSGSTGSPNAISGTVNTYASCTGTAGQTVLTTALSAGNNDIIFIHQTSGTGQGNYEFIKVSSDAGATLNLQTALINSYNSGAQAVLMPQYTGGTISGTVTCTSYNGTIGGIIAINASGPLTISGSLVGSAMGYGGGTGGVGTGSYTASNGTDGSGLGKGIAGSGGDGSISNTGTGGGGGGYGTAGNTALYTFASRPPLGTGGSTYGEADLDTIFLGSGGGGGGGGCLFYGGTQTGGNGGKGGGIVIVSAPSIIVSGSVPCNGANGTNISGGGSPNTAGGGGAGSGGSVLFFSGAVSGSNLVTVTGGTKGSTEGGNGGSGIFYTFNTQPGSGFFNFF